jgi:hypothetical protein
LSSYAGVLLDRYKAKGLLIDANLLLLFLVGSYDLRLVGDGKFNKLSKYTVDDYALLLRLRAVFTTFVTTPHVLTEVSNLTCDLPEATKMECLAAFCQIFDGMNELEISSFELARRPEFNFLGLTDTALAQMSHRFLIVSDDARFVRQAERQRNGRFELQSFAGASPEVE